MSKSTVFANFPATEAIYRDWWESSAPVAYGLCWCGCGNKTRQAKVTRKERGEVKGMPQRFLHGHAGRGNKTRSLVSPNSTKFCLCGCGQKSPIATKTNMKAGWVKGQPMRYVRGHAARNHPVGYVIEDRAYKTPCWIWQGGKNRDGYGHMKVPKSFRSSPGQIMMAHRFFYMEDKGPIPDGWQVDHLCYEPSCVNPSHLEAVTPKENQRRKQERMSRALDLLKKVESGRAKLIEG
jgi:hypothetical protein